MHVLCCMTYAQHFLTSERLATSDTGHAVTGIVLLLAIHILQLLEAGHQKAQEGSDTMEPRSIMDTIEVSVGTRSVATPAGTRRSKPAPSCSPLLYMTSPRANTLQSSLRVDKGVVQAKRGHLFKGTAALKALTLPPGEVDPHPPAPASASPNRSLSPQGLKLFVADTVSSVYKPHNAAAKPSDGGSSAGFLSAEGGAGITNTGACEPSTVHASVALPAMQSKLTRDLQFAVGGRAVPITFLQARH